MLLSQTGKSQRLYILKSFGGKTFPIYFQNRNQQDKGLKGPHGMKVWE